MGAINYGLLLLSALGLLRVGWAGVRQEFHEFESTLRLVSDLPVGMSGSWGLAPLQGQQLGAQMSELQGRLAVWPSLSFYPTCSGPN